MTSATFPGTARRLWPRWAGAALGGYALAGGSLSLAGWFGGPARLTNWDGGGITIKANAALCAAIAGIALISLSLRAGSSRLVPLLGAFFSLVGLVTLLQHLTGSDFGIDTLLVDESAGALATAAPGRMGPPASTSFFLLGTAFVLMPRGRRARAVAAGLALLVAAIAFLSLTGYLYGASVMYSIPRVTGIAFQTASMILAVAMGIIICAPDREPMRLLRSSSGAGALARQTLPFIIIIPTLLGWLHLAAERAGYYDSAFATALFVLGLIALLTAIVWRSLATADQQETALGGSQARINRLVAELVANEQQLRHVTDSVAVSVAQVSRDLRFRFANRTCAQLLQAEPDTLVGRRIVDVIGQEALDRLKPYIDRVLNGEHVEFEYEVPRADGARYTRVVYTPDVDADGHVQGWIAAFTDITDRKRSEVALRDAAAALRDADRRKDEFLATLAHELRNPLAPLSNSLVILERARGDERLAETAIATMQRQLKQMVRMVDDLLDVSRITRDRLELRPERIDIRNVVRDAVDATRPFLTAGSHDVRLRTPPAEVPVVADPARLAQVFGNLVSNACKFSEPGAPIGIVVERDGDGVVVSVHDDGLGIAPDELEKVFDMFTQLDRSLSRSRSGLGIGLTLARRLVEMHGGAIEAQSEGPGRGSTFIVRLPAAPDSAAAAPAVLSPTPVASMALRILVVDDNRDSATSLAELLMLGGNLVRTASDGAEAVEAADEFRPDVILLDIGLPRLNGYEACRTIRASEWARSTLIIALSGWGQDDDRRRSREAGFDHHLVKPADFSALSALIAHHAQLTNTARTP